MCITTPIGRGFLIRNKILTFCKGKKVLHLGAIGFTDLELEDRIHNFNNSLHCHLSKVADVLGIDYSQSVINKLKELKLADNILFGNAEELEKVQLNETFDIIVIGDLIEHLSNPGLLLDGIKKFCDERTRVIITTPNSFGLINFIRNIFNGFNEGAEHVMTFNIQNIQQLVVRYKFKIERTDTCFQKHAYSYGLLFKIFKIFFLLFPKLGGTIFIIIKLNDAAA